MSSSLTDKGGTYRWRKIRERILRRDQRTCQRCGQEGDTVDHIIPRRLGGDDNDNNLQVLCRACNFSKGGKVFDLSLIHI